MGGRYRSAAQKARDRAVIAREYLMGRKQAEIAEMLGLHQTTISGDLKAIQADWLQSALLDFNEMKARELARIDRLEVTYWEAWTKSCEPLVDTLQNVVTGENGEILPSKDQVRTIERGGNPRFLQGVEWCIDRRIKLFGLDDPQTFRVVDEEFDFAKWVANKDARLAKAMQILIAAEARKETADGDPPPES